MPVTATRGALSMNCTYCDLTGADRLVAVVLSSSGGDWTRYAHPPCADARGVEPFDSRLPAEKGRA
ncbi:hypothetical protein [Streptomyces sp. MS2.AVA.5]|uniref:Uncharacterized protein n=2 Tax=Streptomyces achmelvichensis TaxID=3134111 RepID=A0ACC6PMD8_9ACTN